MKYVLVTGGVVSGLGKGVTASSIGLLLKACGLRVTSIKIDPYLNTDAGTMSPFEHGEVFVLDDGGEVDLDLGNYERFLDIKLTRDNNITTGKIYQSVIDRERKGDYLGKTVQVVPHITDAIQEWIERAAQMPVDGKPGPADVCVIELGGTIGDIESMPFIEALGQFSYRVGAGNFCLIHVSLVPVLNVVGEQKTKPTQHSVRGLRSLGLIPHLLACRSTTALDENVKVKLSQFCHVPRENIITLYDVPNIWHIPLLLRDQKAHEAIFKVLNLQSIATEPDLEEWTSRAELADLLHEPVRIAMVGKYTGLSDSYLSVLKALLHASVAQRKKLFVDWIAACDLEDATAKENPDAYKAAWKLLKGADGVLVPGGFGDRGVQGKILAAKYARENRIPYLGICLGMQIAVIEFARSILGLKDANSTEFDPQTKNPCVIFMPEGSKTHMGGTMRLGSRRTFFQTIDCKSAKLYGNKTFVDERHRHRYEVNPEMVGRLEKAGLCFTAKDISGRRMEIVELRNHPYYIGAQFHPEFKSRPGKPSALFSGLIAAACRQLDSLLLQGSENKRIIPMAAGTIDTQTAIIYQNGTATKASNGTLDGIYSICNGPSAKRLKQTLSSTNNKCDANGIIPNRSSSSSSGIGDGGADGLSADQKSRMEFQKLLAKSRRNLKICSQRVSNSQSEGGRGYVKLEELLVEESWLEALPGEFQKPYAKNLSKFLESETSAVGVTVYPPSHLIFNALNSTPFDRVKAVILGQDPYHGLGQAMGLSFSVPEGVKVPSSLVNIFKELKQDVGCSIPSHGNLEKWAVQGVLLLNAVLTVRKHQANSHAKKGWEQFTDAVIKTISQRKEGVVFLLWGNSAQEKRRLIDESKHHILKAAHPSGLSANRGFFGCRHFSRTNELLEKMGIPSIDWQL